MADVVGVLEHCGYGIVVEFGVAAQHGIAEVGQSVQVGTVYFFDELDDKEGVLAGQVVVFQVDDNVLRGGIVDHLAQGFGSAVDVGLGVIGAGNMVANAG